MEETELEKQRLLVTRAGEGRKKNPDVTVSHVAIKEVGLLEPKDHQVCRKHESR